jgi:hypothetical protein
MKRKLLLFAAFVAFSPFIFGQTFIWEAFNAGQMPPSGWTFDGYPDQWSVGNSGNAGCDPPEAIFTYISGNGTSRFISPNIDLTGFTTIKLNFWHMYDDYTGTGPVVGVATRSGGGAWTSAWEISPSANVPATQVDITINNSDVGSSTFQFCFYVSGNLFNLDYWYLDNILLFNPLNLDAGITGITTPTYIGGPSPVTGQIMNFGATTISSAEINWQLDSGPVFSSTFSGLSIANLETYNFTCTDLITATIGTHNLAVWVNKVNGDVDDDQGNDTLVKEINKVSHVVPNKPTFEEFTSSTCAPCASFNSTFVPWCQSHIDQITLVKYQMNWPAPGDPYYTAEGGVRRNYYGVGYVPDLYSDGTQIATDVGAVQTAFDQSLLKPGLLEIASFHTISGTTINVNTTVLPFASFTNARIHIIVFENVTTGNVMSNGETEFHHVMMKMIPDADGTTVNLTDRVPFTITESVDLSGTNVEEYSDLGVAILVQDYATKQIFQSAYSVENGVFNTEARLLMIDMDGAPLPGFNSDVFSYNLTLPSGSTIVPEITADPIDANAVVIIVPTYTLPGATTIDVFAENLVNHNLYTINFAVAGVGVNENPEQAVSVYPNPTKGMIYILNAAGSKVTVYSASGSLLKTVDPLSGNSLDMSGLTQGVYFVVVEKPDHSVIRKKIVIM